MNKDEQFNLAKTQILDRINTWSDLYEFFDEVMGRVNETMHPGLVFDALYTMYAFMHALRELPDEGDIKVIAERMLRVLVYESKEKLGATVTIMTAEEVQELLSKKMHEASVIASAEALEEVRTAGKPRQLH